MSDGVPGEELDADTAEELLETARHRRPPGDDPLAALLTAATAPDHARTRSGEEAAVAAFRAAGRADIQPAAPRRTGRRLVKASVIAATAALALAGAALAADRTGIPLPFTHHRSTHAPTPGPMPTPQPTATPNHAPNTPPIRREEPSTAPPQNPNPHNGRIQNHKKHPPGQGQEPQHAAARLTNPERGHTATAGHGHGNQHGASTTPEKKTPGVVNEPLPVRIGAAHRGPDIPSHPQCGAEPQARQGRNISLRSRKQLYVSRVQ
jgi:hypothetical protein